MKNNFNSLYERFDELYTTYDDRKSFKRLYRVYE